MSSILIVVFLMTSLMILRTVQSYTDWGKIKFFLPAPKDLIPLNTTAGTSLLLNPKSLTSAFFSSFQHLETQQSQTYCSIATSVTILNALSSGKAPIDPIYNPYAYWTQASFFSACTEAVLRKSDLERMGSTLDQLQLMLKCYSQLVYDVKPVYSDQTNVDKFRADLINGLGSVSNGFFAINFHRSELGESGGGHWSPLMSYNEDVDMVLLSDVARYKYPPMWVKVEDLFNSMLTIDDTSNLYRGYIYLSPISAKTDLPVSRNSSQ